jgi:hypothetical protein
MAPKSSPPGTGNPKPEIIIDRYLVILYNLFSKFYTWGMAVSFVACGAVTIGRLIYGNKDKTA